MKPIGIADFKKKVGGHYLAKPSNTLDIEDAFSKAAGNAEVALTETFPKPRGGSACTGAQTRKAPGEVMAGEAQELAACGAPI